MAAELTRLTHNIATQLHIVAEICIICSSSSRRLVRKLLDTHSYFVLFLMIKLRRMTLVRHVARMDDV